MLCGHLVLSLIDWTSYDVYTVLIWVTYSFTWCHIYSSIVSIICSVINVCLFVYFRVTYLNIVDNLILHSLNEPVSFEIANKFKYKTFYFRITKSVNSLNLAKTLNYTWYWYILFIVYSISLFIWLDLLINSLASFISSLVVQN